MASLFVGTLLNAVGSPLVGQPPDAQGRTVQPGSGRSSISPLKFDWIGKQDRAPLPIGEIQVEENSALPGAAATTLRTTKFALVYRSNLLGMLMTADSTLTYVPVQEARAMNGLRVAFTRGVPGAWSVAIKAILDIKGIDYIPVPQDPGGSNEVLKDWTGQTSAPVLMFNDDKARPHWSEMLALAEQLRPEPRLIPVDEEARITMLGLCHEICSEDGLGWNVRLCLLSGERGPPRDQGGDALRLKYRSPVTTEHARQRVRTIIHALAARLDRQTALGNRYLMGTRLTAADIYWTAFSNLFSPMTADLCTMPDSYRGLGPVLELYLEDPLPQILLDHRDYVARNHFQLPIAL